MRPGVRNSLYRVCENALVVGSSVGGQPYVIPWASVRPGSLTVHDPVNRFRRPAGETGDRATRMAVFATRAVSVEGLIADLAHPRLRERTSTAKQLLAGRGEAPAPADPDIS